LSTPNPRHGHALAVETTDLVQCFYESDEVSQIMPGKKDCVSVRQAKFPSVSQALSLYKPCN